MEIAGFSLEEITLGAICGLYGIFVGFVAGGSFEPCTIAGAFDVTDAECKAGVASMQKIKGYGPGLAHTLTLTTRLEGFLWTSIGLSAGLAIKYKALRPGVLLVAAMGCVLAAATHLNHEGQLGAAPWHAISHPFNQQLIVLDLVCGGAAAYCLHARGVFKAKAA